MDLLLQKNLIVSIKGLKMLHNINLPDGCMNRIANEVFPEVQGREDILMFD